MNGYINSCFVNWIVKTCHLICSRRIIHNLLKSVNSPIVQWYQMFICQLCVMEITIFTTTTGQLGWFKATWSVRGFLFLLQNDVNQYKLFNYCCVRLPINVLWKQNWLCNIKHWMFIYAAMCVYIMYVYIYILRIWKLNLWIQMSPGLDLTSQSIVQYFNPNTTTSGLVHVPRIQLYSLRLIRSIHLTYWSVCIEAYLSHALIVPVHDPR